MRKKRNERRRRGRAEGDWWSLSLDGQRQLEPHLYRVF
jgi:hypothetical protein